MKVRINADKRDSFKGSTKEPVAPGYDAFSDAVRAPHTTLVYSYDALPGEQSKTSRNSFLRIRETYDPESL